MGCLESLPYEVIQRGLSYRECREYVRRNCSEVHEVPPGYKLFDKHLIGVPPLAIGIDGDEITFPYTKPCYGTFLVKVRDDGDEIRRLRESRRA